MEASWINLLIQVPLVGIFVWYALRMQAQFEQSNSKRHADRREFLEKQRLLNNQSMENLTQQMAKMTDTLAEVHALTVQHVADSNRRRTK